jgi:uncharacterized protein YbdZ (MbtH family)
MAQNEEAWSLWRQHINLPTTADAKLRLLQASFGTICIL